MATGNDNAIRERHAVHKAIAFGLVMLKRLGEEHALYRIESETDLDIDAVEEFLTMIAAGNGERRL